MRQKLNVCLILTLLVVGGCSSASGMKSAQSDDLTSTWYGYLNPGQMPTVSDIENYYKGFGTYPTLSDAQYRSVIKDPSLWEGFDFSAETK
jgi:hypothetical protein